MIVARLARSDAGMTHDYDFALYRLKCYYEDVYHGISPNANAVDYNPEPPVFACRFCTTPGYEEILALANEDGKIAFQDTRKTYEHNVPLEGTQAHCNAIFDVAWMPGEMKLVTVSGDHTARLWDVASSDIKQINYFHAHTRSVKTAVFRDEDKAVFATGARDGFIMIWDIRASHSCQPKPDNCIVNAHSIGGTGSTRRRSHTQASRAHSITGLVFQDDFTLISCAAGDGLLKVWDLRKNYTVHKKEPIAKHLMNYSGNSTRNGFSSLLICPARITLYASCMDNVIYAYNVSSYNRKPVAKYYGHQNRTYYVKTCLSSDGRYLASGSSDELAYIWNTSKPGTSLVKLSGHTDEVTCIAWCSAGETKIVTCSDDACHKIWRVGLEDVEEDKEYGDSIIRGRAEVVDRLEKMRIQETTPTTRNSNTQDIETTPSSDEYNSCPYPRQGSILTPVMTPESMEDYNGNKHNPAKRSYLQMSRSEGFKCILSPIFENHESAAKRVHINNRGMRRLFDSTPSTSRDYNSDEPSTSQSTSRNEEVFSPTLNLPNFVIDGTAPHLLEISPQKYKENVDWLTKIRKERYEQKKAASSSPKTQLTPGRRSNRSRSTEPQKVTKPTKSVSLLDFFKPSIAVSKDSKKDLPSNSDNTPSSSTS
ncbi:protein lethal(2)denticleless isoform X2 [Monomorium pharaonis]|uniref:protein lethal(2)denticleless isoform X2 n=1 Tax=Monomorium pharaonis TaxID=307658 RepID=UPI00102E19A5|nr:protein lethal(2)denticleless isoform X2 [Monomorium pharaonis]